MAWPLEGATVPMVGRSPKGSSFLARPTLVPSLEHEDGPKPMLPVSPALLMFFKPLANELDVELAAGAQRAFG